MSGLSNYFHPDPVMQMLAGLISDGLKYHAAAMKHIAADDQVDKQAWDEAIGKVFQDPKMAVATMFRDNKLDVLPKIRQFFVQKLTLNVSFSKMRRRFVREIARITAVPKMKAVANVNGGSETTKVKAAGNVAVMDDWREKKRKRA